MNKEQLNISELPINKKTRLELENELKLWIPLLPKVRSSIMDKVDKLISNEIQQAIAEHEIDTKRLDKLQSLTKGYGNGWLLRESTLKRGMRLQETSSDNAVSDVRIAIDNYELPESYQPEKGGEG